MAKNDKTHFFYVLYSDKTRVFDQSERAYYPIYIINIYTYIYIYIYIYIYSNKLHNADKMESIVKSCDRANEASLQ